MLDGYKLCMLLFLSTHAKSEFHGHLRQCIDVKKVKNPPRR